LLRRSTPPPQAIPGWVYVFTCPDFPGCCKIGGTSRTASHRAAELRGQYGTEARFQVIDRHPVADWFAVEQAVHRMLSDCRLPRSELFRVPPAEAARVIRAAAAAHARPWAVTVWLRRLVLAPRVRPSWRRYRRGTNWLPLLMVLAVAVAGVMIAKPALPAWVPVPVTHTLVLLERL
jgi:hypothetical protein